MAVGVSIWGIQTCGTLPREGAVRSQHPRRAERPAPAAHFSCPSPFAVSCGAAMTKSCECYRRCTEYSCFKDWKGDKRCRGRELRRMHAQCDLRCAQSPGSAQGQRLALLAGAAG